MDAYGDFARVYDELMDETPYELWKNRIVAAIEKYGISKPSPVQDISRDFSEECEIPLREEIEAKVLETEKNLVVDLGCGTGTLTQLLAEQGYDMIGVDCSEDMLQLAMEKRENSGLEILYLLQDMRELELYSTVGTVISVCDSINYLLEEEELVQTFGNVWNYLFPGGVFVFDFNTDYKYREVIGDTTIAENREDCSFIWENYYDPEEQINEYDLTVFVQTEGDSFRRFQETHLQRGFDAEQIRGLLEQTGFTVLSMTDADSEEAVTETSERIFVIARCEKTVEDANGAIRA